MIPGEYFVADGDIELNAGRATLTVVVTNTVSDRLGTVEGRV